MRRHSPGDSSVLSMASIDSLNRKSSIYQRARSTNHNNSRVMEQIGDIRREKVRQPLIKFRVKHKEKPNLSEIVESNKPLLSRELKKAHKEIVEIKNQIKRQHSFTQGSSEEKLNRFISLLRDSVSQKQSQPIYYPVPMPVPYIMQNQHSLPAIQSHNKNKHASFTNSRQSQFQTPLRDPGRDKQIKAMRVKKNMCKWRMVGNAVLFWLYFKRFCANVRKSRLVLFDKFWKNYSISFKNVVNIIKEKMNHFFKVLIIKNDVNFGIQEGEQPQIKREKVALMRGIIKMILEGLAGAFSNHQPQISKFVYFLCRHGSYSCTRSLLTYEQLQLSCISGAFGYISADRNLSKAAIINLLYFKTLLYSIFLSPFQLPPQFNTQVIRENLLLVSSVLYELAIEVQDEYLIKVPKSYRIGNFQSFDFVKMRESMVVEKAEYRPGQLISGLLDQGEIKRSFVLSDWGQQKKLIKIYVHTISESMKSIHRKLVQRHY